MNPKGNIKDKSEETQQDQDLDNNSPQKPASDKEKAPISSTNKSGTRGG
ncbi:hypothetical protein [Chryseobacterium sp. M5A1_1a]